MTSEVPCGVAYQAGAGFQPASSTNGRAAVQAARHAPLPILYTPQSIAWTSQ
jgi:hypothetical protein